MVELAAVPREDFVELVGLRRGARIAIEDRADLGTHLGQLGIDHRRNDLVRNKPARIHDVGDRAAQFGIGLARVTQHVTGRELAHAMMLDQSLSLRSLTGARRAQEDNVHRVLSPSPVLCLNAGVPSTSLF